jgi:ATP-dependent 26S proteasome regulatory subunit
LQGTGRGGRPLTELFDLATRNQPSLVLFEDLDRLYSPGASRRDENRTGITLQHLLNAIDGVGSREGVIVVATANDVATLDPALTQRPGRFDRVVSDRQIWRCAWAI